MGLKLSSLPVTILLSLLLFSLVLFFLSQYFLFLVADQPLRSNKPEGHIVTEQPSFYSEIGVSHFHSKNLKAIALPSYTVELASFRDESLAQDMVRKLSSKGIDCFYTPFNQQGMVVFRVRSGMFGSIQKAQQQSDFLAKELAMKGHVTKL